MTKQATISLVSFQPLKKDEPDRLRKTLELMGRHIDTAAQRSSDLIAFPEICNYLSAHNENTPEPLAGSTITAMAKKAKEHNIYVLCPLRTEEDGKYYNSAVLIDRKGEIAGVYHKNYPTPEELETGTIPGTEVPVFETDFGRIGLCICFDLNFREVGIQLAANRAELVLWPSMWWGMRHLPKWCLEHGFAMGALCPSRASMTDVAGREIACFAPEVSQLGGAPPILTTTMDLGQRLLHPNSYEADGNLEKLKKIYLKYGTNAVSAETLTGEAAMIFASNLENRSSDELLEEFNMETMHKYMERVRQIIEQTTR